MTNTVLSKLDYKGKLIVAYNITTSVNEYPWGITTDHNYLRIMSSDQIAVKGYEMIATKKGKVVQKSVNDNSRRFAIVFDGVNYWVGSGDGLSAFLHRTPGAKVFRNVNVTPSVAMGFSRRDIYSVKGSTAAQVTDPKALQAIRTVTLSGSATGITLLEDYFVTVEGSSFKYYSYKGGLIKSIALPNTDSVGYRDVTHDNQFFWLSGYQITDEEPV